MTLEEKVGQLVGVWLDTGSSAGDVAPMQQEMSDEEFDWDATTRRGLGHLTRPFGTAPVAPRDGARHLAALQEHVTAANRFGLPALAHEECLTGWTTWRATIYPTPLAWGATFDASLVERMASRIGADMRSLGVHQGLAPVLDVTRDPRWGRTEETIGEDPYLVGLLATAYVRGLQSEGVHATLKHFVGYSASRAGRNHAPVSMGSRERAELLLPFEMAVRDGGARSVMATYVAVDGVPAHADTALLTGVLREQWGFDGVVVADYFGVKFLETFHGVAADEGEAAKAALEAGLDVELPMVHCFGAPLVAAVRAGRASEDFVDRAALRVLEQKAGLGLLDPDWSATPARLASADAETAPIDLDPPASRELAREIAESSVVLLSNTGTLPIPDGVRISLVGPLADAAEAMLGCYSFPRHVGRRHPEVGLGVEVPTVLASLRRELPDADIRTVPGCTVRDTDTSGIAEAVEAAADTDVCVAVVGDHAGVFTHATSGEGCDAADLTLPGAQDALLTALRQRLDGTGTALVVVVMSGRPYALGAHVEGTTAAIQAFFPGEEGGPAVAGVLSGRVNPSGRLPVSVPRIPGGQPSTYLSPRLGRETPVSTLDPTPLFPFGHGMSYTRFDWDDVRVDDRPLGEDETVEFAAESPVRLSVRVRNTGPRAGSEIVQLYLRDPVAEVTPSVTRLMAFHRVALEAGEARRVEFDIDARRFAFVGRAGEWVLEPGAVDLLFASSSEHTHHHVRGRVSTPHQLLGHDRPLHTPSRVR
ncbi:glycoside hydrolase family 3 C-terminal domain-containing protein [Spiractinospora alimapuensis]|nr:glycoside hydrolase family 3 C-terminal domain-containing protein [Spiractinospora alimapuensis]